MWPLLHTCTCKQRTVRPLPTARFSLFYPAHACGGYALWCRTNQLVVTLHPTSRRFAFLPVVGRTLIMYLPHRTAENLIPTIVHAHTGWFPLWQRTCDRHAYRFPTGCASHNLLDYHYWFAPSALIILRFPMWLLPGHCSPYSIHPILPAARRPFHWSPTPFLPLPYSSPDGWQDATHSLCSTLFLLPIPLPGDCHLAARFAFVLTRVLCITGS